MNPTQVLNPVLNEADMLDAKRAATSGTIGVIGGGQLGRMLALSAANLGIRTHVFDPDPQACAAQVADRFTCASWDDEEALARFGDMVDVITYEFENIAVGPLEAINRGHMLYPPVRSWQVSQDRAEEKAYAAALGLATPAWRLARTREEFAEAVTAVGLPAVAKTARLGYDGKGQARLNHPQDIDPAWDRLHGVPLVVEGWVDFAHEFSVLLVRARSGAVQFWDCPENVHEGGVLARSSLPPAPLVQAQQPQAQAMARALADALGHVGVMAVEFFACATGPLFNEMAPRVHNSGHWTIEGAATSQFENHIRAVMDLPLGDTATRPADIVMRNLIGADIAKAPTLMHEAEGHLHLYGKGEARPGRKMGHFTQLRWWH